jgi:hypothetical protein
MALHDLRCLSDKNSKVVRQVDDNLRGVLAYLAATGETCQVKATVDAVRAARHCLRASAPGQAQAALTEALHCLPGEPVRRRIKPEHRGK